ncbi:MAG TPA: HIT domain-containing protein [Deltaproteobacteria bacterium]|nr:HIT domain-containing protein [Deltaproteobacteria bacterium]
MKQLWAPWRLQYIAEADRQPPRCIFCDAASAGPPGSDGLVLRREALATVMLNKYPYSNGHILIAPASHKAAVEDLDGDESASLFSLVQRSVSVLKEAFSPDGFNIGMNLGNAAGAGIEDHLHVHVVPRWGGDTNFMPVLADTRVIPQHLEETARLLRPRFGD